MANNPNKLPVNSMDNTPILVPVNSKANTPDLEHDNSVAIILIWYLLQYCQLS